MLASDEVTDDVVKMYQAGKLDALTAMKMLSGINSQSTSPQGTPSPKPMPGDSSKVPPVPQGSSLKRPKETETCESDTDEEMEGEDFKHLDPLPIVVQYIFAFKSAIGLCTYPKAAKASN